MNKTSAVALLLLLGVALAGSALENNDFHITVWDNPKLLKQGGNTVKISIEVDARKAQTAYGVTVRFTPPHALSSGETEKTISEAITPTAYQSAYWEIGATQLGTYDLSNAFEVVSWDDSVELDADKLPETTNEKTVTISGQTDGATYCEEHNYSGFWGEPENCQVRIFLNAEEAGWAAKDGSFSFEHGLEEGENQIIIGAMDPGGNTNETTEVTMYTPPWEQKHGTTLLLVGGVLIAGALAFVLKRVHEMKQIEENVKTIIDGAIAKAQLGDLLEAEKQVFDTYQQGKGLRSLILQLTPLWKKIIELTPDLNSLTGEETEGEITAVLMDANPNMRTLTSGVRFMIVKQYISLVKKRGKGKQ